MLSELESIRDHARHGSQFFAKEVWEAYLDPASNSIPSALLLREPLGVKIELSILGSSRKLSDVVTRRWEACYASIILYADSLIVGVSASSLVEAILLAPASVTAQKRGIKVEPSSA